MIAVFDANIWISAILFGGVPRQAILRAAARDELTISNRIEIEIGATLCSKFHYTEDQAAQAVARIRRSAIHVQVTGTIHGVCRDPNDDHLIECAHKAGAALIVTGDKDLLSLGSVENIRIMSPREYLEATEQQH